MDMQLWFISSLIFAVSNSEIVTIRFMWKQIQLSQSVVILGSAALGAVIIALIGTFSKVKSSLKVRELKKQVKDLEIKLEKLQGHADGVEVKIEDEETAVHHGEEMQKEIEP
jgi:uncharacterized integral membrane protein